MGEEGGGRRKGEGRKRVSDMGERWIGEKGGRGGGGRTDGGE